MSKALLALKNAKEIAKREERLAVRNAILQNEKTEKEECDQAINNI